MKIIVAIFSLIIVIFGTFIFEIISQNESVYQGLPTVACINPTEKIVQNFSLTIQIYIKNNNFPLDSNIGHDFGNCLHYIFTNDSSGKVFIKSNSLEPLTLGQFFDVWHKAFSEKRIFSFQTNTSHKIRIYVDGKINNDYRNLILKSDQLIEISFL